MQISIFSLQKPIFFPGVWTWWWLHSTRDTKAFEADKLHCEFFILSCVDIDIICVGMCAYLSFEHDNTAEHIAHICMVLHQISKYTACFSVILFHVQYKSHSKFITLYLPRFVIIVSISILNTVPKFVAFYSIWSGC